MRIVIRADASRWIGSGHVMRCLVLADALKARGDEVVFACRPQAGELTTVIQQRGHAVVLLPEVENPPIPSHNADYEAWLQVPWPLDCQQVQDALQPADWVIVDHYGIPAEWEQQLAQAWDCRILAIDDLCRPHCCDLLVDQTALRAPSDYAAQVPAHCRALVGAEYALLSPLFAQWRAKLEGQARDPANVLVSMGGIDEPNATLKVLRALEAEPLQLTVLLSPRAPHYQAVKAYCQQHADCITHIDFCQDMAALMAEHGLAIGAPGSTSWERACLGLPSVVVPLAENQMLICDNLVRAEAALCVPVDKIGTELVPALQQLRNDYTHFQAQNRALCDGQGSLRVLGHMIDD
ncbi:UDP-2,4-diacetamido-2,4,6-trideoxy-beta-L-altropyranose hydrolase [Marinobacter hydrocarbonoclasticus]|nr:UDP-2,4-diacetamido-2,4,6-trideoxy-beta-L-altropyranose hydrolase [Marinobacter nauticus]